jgi:signal transduction histidine kinase/CheY-like chemotaxis protein
MGPHDIGALMCSLANRDERRAALVALAARLSAADVYVFVPHPDVRDRLITAPGCPQTLLPASRGWRALLARCTRPGVHVEQVAHPVAGELATAVAYAYPGVAVVAVGARAGAGPAAERDEIHRAIGVAAPLLAGMLRAELDVVGARSEVETAREATDRASTLALALDGARGEAERATRVKDEFLAMLGHELRNPLAPIVTALQMLRFEGIHTRAQDILERQVGHMMRLIDDLLDVSRITQGKIELRRERVEIATVVRRAVEIARPLLEQRRSELVLDLPDGLTVDGDPARLAQVLSNLVTNAAKYSDAGAEIRIVAERVEDRLRVTVEDRGIGIDPAFLDRVFDQFVQVPQGLERSAGGLGLGLAIVRSLVALHAGTVTAFSAGRGEGSRFVVELPFAGPLIAPAVAEAATTRPRGANAKVLVVDDSPDAAELLGGVLEKHGYRVRIAHSGPEALDVLANFTPDIGLLDIGLPVMDGYELAGALRDRIPRIRLVAITGYGQQSDRDRALAAGFDAHLVKPVKVERVRQALDLLLGTGAIATGTPLDTPTVCADSGPAAKRPSAST